MSAWWHLSLPRPSYQLLEELNFPAGKEDHNRHSPLIGWAADGFPVRLWLQTSRRPKSGIAKLTTSFQLKGDDQAEVWGPVVDMTGLLFKIMNLLQALVSWMSAMDDSA